LEAGQLQQGVIEPAAPLGMGQERLVLAHAAAGASAQ
jgi:hypothetical protein